MNTKKDNGQLAGALQQHVYKLAHQIGNRSVFEYEQLNAAREYIVCAFRSFGYDVAFQEYRVLGKTVENIIATKIGKEKPQEMIVVGAHYDTCFNPGADDNASAIAGLLELARYTSQRKTNKTIKFVAFVNEEPPFFKTEDMGSRVYAREAKKGKEDIKAVLILEMIGYYSDRPHSQRYPLFLGPFYPNKGNFIAVVGNFRSRRLVKKIISCFKRYTRFPIESVVDFGFVSGADFSDHWSFWKEGYPAVMITDTAFYRNPHYHSNSDTYEKLDYEGMAEVARGFISVLMELTE